MSKKLIEASLEFAEVIIDQDIDSGILKDIPVVGLFYKMASSYNDIRNIIFIKKMNKFIEHINAQSDESKKIMTDKIAKSKDFAEYIGETIVLCVERSNDVRKSEFIAKLFIAFCNGYLDKYEFKRACDVVSNHFIDDIDRFICRNTTDKVTSGYLSGSPLISVTIDNTSNNVGKISYNVTMFGSKFINAINFANHLSSQSANNTRQNNYEVN